MLQALQYQYVSSATLKGTKSGVKAIVKETGKAGDTAVYLSRTAEKTVQYVGITNDLARRAAAHLVSKGIRIQPLMQGLSRTDARAVEQALIEIHCLGMNGGTLRSTALQRQIRHTRNS